MGITPARAWFLKKTAIYRSHSPRANHREMQNAMFDLLIGVV
jgi:hypothetical protein